MDLTRRLPDTVDAAAIDDPGELLEAAWALAASLRLTELAAVFGRLEQVLAHDPPSAPPGRDWAAELAAERAFDAVRRNELDRAMELVRSVRASGTASRIALARVTEVEGSVLAWTGTDAATARADRVLAEAARLYTALGAAEWAGAVTFWRGNTVYLQNGDLRRAEELIRESLDLLAPDSPRRASILTFLADIPIALGRWDDAERLLGEAAALAERDADRKTHDYVGWSRARMASVRLDAMTTERLVREVEREAGDWFAMNTGVNFLADAAEMLDRVGLSEQAAGYLARAREREPDDEFVRQAEAALLARGRDPEQALEALQALMRGDWLEKRWRWRHTLLAAWVTFRAGREGAGVLAAQALEQAEHTGGVDVALSTESELTRALLPLAAEAGSAIASTVLLGGRLAAVRVFGPLRVIGADGAPLDIPPGQPAELVRLLAVQSRGLSTEQVLDALFPDADVAAARNRLRQVLSRLRAAAGDIVVRVGDRLQLAPCWVDVREFRTAADRVRLARGPRAVHLAYAALALWGGSPLPDDAYADWAAPTRDELEQRHLMLLDLVVADAESRGSHQEVVTALSASLEHNPYEPERYYAIAEHLIALGRHATAHHLARLAGVDLDRRGRSTA